MSAQDRARVGLAIVGTAVVAAAIFSARHRAPPPSPVAPPPQAVAALDASDGAKAASAEGEDAAAFAANRTAAKKPSRDLRAAPPPETRTARPLEAEWESAESVNLRLSSPCDALLVREWMRVKCFGAVHSGSLVAGDSAEFTVDADSSLIVATFPVRRGDRRVFQFEFSETFSYQSDPTTDPPLTISEAWFDGDPAPSILASAPSS